MILPRKGFSLRVPAVMNDAQAAAPGLRGWRGGGGLKARSLLSSRFERTSDLCKCSKTNLILRKRWGNREPAVRRRGGMCRDSLIQRTVTPLYSNSPALSAAPPPSSDAERLRTACFTMARQRKKSLFLWKKHQYSLKNSIFILYVEGFLSEIPNRTSEVYFRRKLMKIN